MKINIKFNVWIQSKRNDTEGYRSWNFEQLTPTENGKIMVNLPMFYKKDTRIFVFHVRIV